jgi:hypothetical protein
VQAPEMDEKEAVQATNLGLTNDTKRYVHYFTSTIKARAGSSVKLHLIKLKTIVGLRKAK